MIVLSKQLDNFKRDFCVWGFNVTVIFWTWTMDILRNYVFCRIQLQFETYMLVSICSELHTILHFCDSHSTILSTYCFPLIYVYYNCYMYIFTAYFLFLLYLLGLGGRKDYVQAQNYSNASLLLFYSTEFIHINIKKIILVNIKFYCGINLLLENVHYSKKFLHANYIFRYLLTMHNVFFFFFSCCFHKSLRDGTIWIVCIWNFYRYCRNLNLHNIQVSEYWNVFWHVLKHWCAK